MSTRRRPLTLLTSTLVLAGLACSLSGAPSASPMPSTQAPPEAATPTAMVVSTPAAEPLVVTHLGAEFQIYALDGTLLETRSAEGLSWARPNTAQVVGQAIYFVAEGAGEDGAVVRRVTSTGTSDLEFTRSDDPSLIVTFAVSEDEFADRLESHFLGRRASLQPALDGRHRWGVSHPDRANRNCGRHRRVLRPRTRPVAGRRGSGVCLAGDGDRRLHPVLRLVEPVLLRCRLGRHKPGGLPLPPTSRRLVGPA